MSWNEWYASLIKPDWTPPGSTIGLIWAVLYPIIFVTFGIVFVRAWRGQWGRRATAPFVINLLSNLAFMPLFAGLRSIPLATLDIVVVWLSLVWLTVEAWPRSRLLSLAQVPYLAWVSIATTIQVRIWWANS